jgi:hypothetical protein
MTAGNGVYDPPNMPGSEVELALDKRAHSSPAVAVIFESRCSADRALLSFYLFALFASSTSDPISPICKSNGSSDDLT